MKLRQWEILKAKPPGWQSDHWFVVVSCQELLDAPQELQVNGLACFTLRGQPKSWDVVLDSADGLERATACPCHLMFILDKKNLHSSLGLVSWERQQQIKSKLKSVFRF